MRATEKACLTLAKTQSEALLIAIPTSPMGRAGTSKDRSVDGRHLQKLNRSPHPPKSGIIGRHPICSAPERSGIAGEMRINEGIGLDAIDARLANGAGSLYPDPLTTLE